MTLEAMLDQYLGAVSSANANGYVSVHLQTPDGFMAAWRYATEDDHADIMAQLPWVIASWYAATRYIIARDFGEFDPQRADMLWKLQEMPHDHAR